MLNFILVALIAGILNPPILTWDANAPSDKVVKYEVQVFAGKHCVVCHTEAPTESVFTENTQVKLNMCDPEFTYCYRVRAIRADNLSSDWSENVLWPQNK